MTVGLSHLLVGVVYFVLATGTVWQTFHFGVFTPLYVSFLAICVLLARSDRSPSGDTIKKSELLLFALLLTFFSYYLARGVLAYDASVFFRRIDGGVFATAIAVMIVVPMLAKTTLSSFFQRYLTISFSVLLLTLLYKLSFGFWIREVRYFLNGPIVFGWLMGFALVLRIYYWSYGSIVVNTMQAVGFAFALAWSLSKGPIVAFSICFSVLLLMNLRDFRFLGVALLAIFLSLVFLDSTLIDVDRILVLFELIKGESSTEASYGSVGIRSHMWRESIMIFQDNPLTGVGVTNWVLFSKYPQLEYPHNIYLELLSETGVIGITLLVVLQFILFYRSPTIIRLAMLYFFLCSFFSGDMSYLRFHLALPLAHFLARGQRCES